MIKRTSKLATIAALPIVLITACSGGGGGGNQDTNGVNATAMSSVPLAGQFLATCSETAPASVAATIDSFSAQTPLAGAAGLPTASEVLASGDPDKIDVIGGLVPSSDDPSTLVPISIEETEAMIPSGGLPADLPVIGNVPITCGDSPQLPTIDPTDALGLVPVFNEGGDPVALVLVTVSELQSGQVPSVVELPDPSGTLPPPFDSTVSTLLAMLPLPTATPTPTAVGTVQPTPTMSQTPAPTPTPGGFCGGPFNIPCPSGQICIVGTCQGL
jgi:hypothetical protein